MEGWINQFMVWGGSCVLLHFGWRIDTKWTKIDQSRQKTAKADRKLINIDQSRSEMTEDDRGQSKPTEPRSTESDRN